jgi:TPR repeat protein
MKYFTSLLTGVLLVLLNSCAPNNKLTTSKETSSNSSASSSSVSAVMPTSASTNQNTIAAIKQSVIIGTGVFTPANATTTQTTTAISSLSDSAALNTVLGNNFLYGYNNVDMNVVKAKNYNKKGVASNSAEAMYNLGILYLKETGSKRNMAAALDLFQQAADLNYVPAMVNLGHLYQRGDSVTQDFAKAFQLYKQAADLGDQNGIYWTGYMFYKGLGTAQNYSKAIEYFKNDSLHGEERAIYLLGYCNIKAYGTNQNLDKAKKYLALAFKNGDEHAKYLALHQTLDSIKNHPNPDPDTLADIRNNRLVAGAMPVSGNTASADSLQGTWKGKFYVYDWSRKVIESVQEMTLKLKSNGGGLSGTWSLQGQPQIQFSASPGNEFWQVEKSSADSIKNFRFRLDSLSCKVTKHSNSVCLTGTLERVLREDNEPMRPTYFILDKGTDSLALTQTAQDTTFVITRIYPNPMDNELHIDFTVKKTDDITFQVQSQAGVAYVSTQPQNYQPGIYSVTLYPSLPIGDYNLVAFGKKYKLTRTIIKK